ncbi:MAG: S8 family serine peptidase, partial [Chloroflexi bacterium]|nr:S8 family serine peptidase [Chloroflexota bacterium]
MSDVGRGIGSLYYVLPKDLTNGEAYRVLLRHRIGSASSDWSSEVEGTPGDLASFVPTKGVAVGGWLDDDQESDTFSVTTSSSTFTTVCYVEAAGLGSDLTFSTSPSSSAAASSYYGKWSRHVLAASGTYTVTISGGSESGSGYDLLCRDAPTDATSRAQAYEIDERWPSDVRWGRQYDSYWYRFTVAEEQYVSARTLHYMDTVLILTDSTGNEVARSDDGWELGHVWTSAIPPRQVPPGTYYLEVWFPRTESWDDHSTYGQHQSYRNIALHTEFIDSFEGGAARASASPLSVDGFLATQAGRLSAVSGSRRVLLEGASIRPQYGLLDSAGEADYWQLRVDDSAEANSDDSSPIVIRGTSTRHSGLAAEVLDSEGNATEFVSYRRDSFGGGEHEGVGVDAFTVSGSFPNGTYYVKVYSVDPEQSAVSYVLTAAHDRETTGFQVDVANDTSPCDNSVPSGIEDPFFPCQWHLRQANAINVRDAWSAGHSGSGVEIAVIDDGVDMEHVDLRVDHSKGVNFSGGTDPFDWTRRHGTAVAGIASSKGTSQGGGGVAYGS